MKRNVTLKVDEDIYDKYRDFCRKEGLIVSRQVEIFMEGKLNEIKES